MEHLFIPNTNVGPHEVQFRQVLLYSFVKMVQNFLFSETCSWASDNTRCYSGVCGTGTKDPASDCECETNFGGEQCENSESISSVRN